MIEDEKLYMPAHSQITVHYGETMNTAQRQALVASLQRIYGDRVNTVLVVPSAQALASGPVELSRKQQLFL